MPRTRAHTPARWLLVFLLAVNVYRAATQSITTDEAFTYLRSVLTPIPELWQSYDANDHVLHTFLCKASVKLFGASEFTPRIPALLGGVLLLVSALRLCRLLFGDGWYMLAAFALIALNPFVLDYCSIARGYGMATAFLLFSLDQLLRYLQGPFRAWRLYAAGIGLGLGVAANLTVVVPGFALALVFAGIHLGEAARQRNWPRVRARFDHFVDHMAVPCVVATVALLLGPLLAARREHFYVGAKTLHDSLVSFNYACFWRVRNLLENTPLHYPVENFWLGVSLVLPGVILGAGVIVALRDRERNGMLLGGLCLISAALVLALHSMLGAPLPERRTGLYFVPLLTLLAAVVVFRLPRWAQVMPGGLAALVLAQFLLSWNVRVYDEWLMDAGNRDLALYLRSHAPPPGRKLKFGGTFPLYQGAQFYSRLYHVDWLEFPPPKVSPDDDYDVYFLDEKDHYLIGKRHLTLRYLEPFSKVAIAAPADSPLRP
ncbi:MAG: glycosyltransferase family 39 protein [Bryobacterales bacterium]|nr:glycosyltransferase family 39 protein [Bryobacterales bacterium]